MGIRHQAMGTDPLYNTVPPPRQEKMSVKPKQFCGRASLKRTILSGSFEKEPSGKIQRYTDFFGERYFEVVRAA